MIHRVLWRVASDEALVFWERRLAAHATVTERHGTRLRFADPEGLAHELVPGRSRDAPLIADHPEIPSAFALQGFEGVCAYGRPERSGPLLEGVMNATAVGEALWELRGAERGGTIAFDPPPAARGIPGAGTVHHVAWGTTVEQHPAWLARLREFGVSSTPVIDRHYFHSIYFREPSGILFEIADDGPGFARDGSIEELGIRLILPPWFESRRAEIEAALTPIPDPREGRGARTSGFSVK